MMFQHQTCEVPNTNLNAVMVGRRRYYQSSEGVNYPSITTVLSANPEKLKSLAQWRKRIGKVEAHAITSAAATRGTAAHLICERYIDNDQDPERGAMPDSIAMFRALKPTIDEHVGMVLGQEVPMFSHHLGVAGRVDLIAEWDGKPTIVDFKTSLRPKKEEWIHDYFRQCAGYAAMYYEMTGVPIRDIVVAIMVADVREPQIFHEKVMPWLPSLKKAIDYFNKEVAA